MAKIPRYALLKKLAKANIPEHNKKRDVKPLFLFDEITTGLPPAEKTYSIATN